MFSWCLDGSHNGANMVFVDFPLEWNIFGQPLPYRLIYSWVSVKFAYSVPLTIVVYTLRVSTTKNATLNYWSIIYSPYMSRDISSNEESKCRKHDRVNLVFEKQPLKTINWCSLDVSPAHIMELTTFFWIFFWSGICSGGMWSLFMLCNHIYSIFRL